MSESYSESYRLGELFADDQAAAAGRDPLAEAIGDSVLAQGMGMGEEAAIHKDAAEMVDFNSQYQVEEAMAYLESDPVNGASDFASRALDPNFLKFDAFEANQVQFIGEIVNGLSGITGTG